MVGDPCIGQHSGHTYPCTNAEGFVHTDTDKRLSPSFTFSFLTFIPKFTLTLHLSNTHSVLYVHVVVSLHPLVLSFSLIPFYLNLAAIFLSFLSPVLFLFYYTATLLSPSCLPLLSLHRPSLPPFFPLHVPIACSVLH